MQNAPALRYAIRIPTVGKYTGQLCLALALLTLAPLCLALLFGEPDAAGRYALVVAVLLAAGYPLSRLRGSTRIQTNEAMVVTCAVFLIAPLVMTYPLTGAGLSFVDALFEAVSAATTTGLSTLSTVEDKPPVFLFTRAWMQWYGGLGIVILSLAILVRPGLTAKTLAVAENVDEDLAGGTRAYARHVVLSYAAITLGGIILLWILQRDLFNAVLYTFSAVSTGGFAPHDASLAAYDSRLYQWAVTGLSLLGAVSLSLYHGVVISRRLPPYGTLQVKALLAAGAIVTLLLCFFFLRSGLSWEDTLHEAPLLGLSAQSTTGFSTVQPGRLDAAAKATLLFSMLVGGGIGSTSGGIKILRLLIVLRFIQVTLVKTCLPQHAVLNTRLGGQRLQHSDVLEPFCLIFLFIAVIGGSWLLFLAMGYDPLDSLFEVVSATGTVGLSTGITAPELPSVLKGVLCVDMLLGRLEIIAWLVLVYPKTWLGKRSEV